VLSVDDIIRLYEEGVKIRFRRKPDPGGDRGDYDPDRLEVNVYLSHNESREDLELTILHELYHAKDDIINDRDYSPERLAEKEAKRTYRCRPEVLETVKEMWGLK
jgi:hypothetical protein